MYVCLCHSVTDREVHAAVRAGARTLEDLAERLDLGTNCGQCLPCAADLLGAALAALVQPQARPVPGPIPAPVPGPVPPRGFRLPPSPAATPLHHGGTVGALTHSTVAPCGP